MISEQAYAIGSLELHLFWGRIMKEHAIFLEAGFTPQGADFARVAALYQAQFENVLHHTVQLGEGVVSPAVTASGELVTDFTLGCEEKTQRFTGIIINTDLTKAEAALQPNANPRISPALMQQVRQLNASVLPWIDGLIAYKTKLLDEVLSCEIFTANYPATLTHMIHEAEKYRSDLMTFERGEETKDETLFWDNDMMEHMAVIAGLLDPSEKALIQTANGFAAAYQALLQKTQEEARADETLALTEKCRDFKAEATEGIAACKIRSIILPLLADHVLREANHFIRLLS
ncbi:MAG: DUF2935 domain-containing protein [Clostridiales bacterium]|nr:DUF2935 domain-containing protein [Clostridiales bacterium]